MRPVRSAMRSLTRAAVAGIALGGLSACSSGLSIDDPKIGKLAAAENGAVATMPMLVAMKPLGGGAPEGVTQRLMVQINAIATKRNIALLIDLDAKAPRSLQGNVWLRPDVSGTKLVHVWDVAGAAGERVNRARGEETLAPPAISGDPWSAVTDAQIATVAEMAIAALGATTAK